MRIAQFSKLLVLAATLIYSGLLHAQALQNPVMATGFPFADPAVVKASDGYYYAYATQLPFEKDPINVQTARSKDLINWESLPDSMPKRPSWAKKNQNVWAPHVEHIQGKYLMYVSIQLNEGNFAIAVGESASAAGPFKNFKKLVVRKSFEAIDPSVFRDPNTEKLFLIWGSASKPLYIQELEEDGLSLKKSSDPTAILKPIREPRGNYMSEDGFVYGFGTQLGPEGDGIMSVQARRSKDAVHWESLPDAVPNRPSWAKGKPDHFAPQVIKIGSEYRMYLAFDVEGDKAALSVGTSKNPAGPFDNFKILNISERWKKTNPFVAEQDGKLTLYWEDMTKDSKKIFYRDLNSDGLSFEEKTKAKWTIKAKPWMKLTKTGYDDLIEAGWMSYRKGYYYLYYSGDECCSRYAHYAVSVARSKSPFGPFERMSEAKGTPDSVILKSSAKWIGPGHHSIITDEKGQEWILFHAIDKKNFFSHLSSDRKEPYRALLMDKISYDADGWPVISETRQVRSVVPSRPAVSSNLCRAIFSH